MYWKFDFTTRQQRKNHEKIAFLTLIGLCLLALPLRAEIKLLHEFAGGAADGAHPEGSMLIINSTLYGMTAFGGNSNVGTIFKIDIDGNNSTVLHELSHIVGEGVNPDGSLIISGSNLYGMTPLGGKFGKVRFLKWQLN